MAIGVGAALAALAKGESATMPESAKFDQRVSVLTLGVRDLAASRKFYVQGLGWKPAFENSDIIFFQTGGMVFALFARDQLAADFDADPSSFGRPPCSLGYNVRTKGEVDPLLAHAASAGAKVLKPPMQQPWGGYSGYFADPDGFAWEVAWNPFWPIAADGTIKFAQ